MSANEESGPQLSGGSADFGDHAMFGVLTVSDRASQKVYDDISGPAILQFFQQAIKSKYFQCPCSTTAMSISCVKQAPDGLQCTKSFQMSAMSLSRLSSRW